MKTVDLKLLIKSCRVVLLDKVQPGLRIDYYGPRCRELKASSSALHQFPSAHILCMTCEGAQQAGIRICNWRSSSTVLRNADGREGPPNRRKTNAFNVDRPNGRSRWWTAPPKNQLGRTVP